MGLLTATSSPRGKRTMGRPGRPYRPCHVRDVICGSVSVYSGAHARAGPLAADILTSSGSRSRPSVRSVRSPDARASGPLAEIWALASADHVAFCAFCSCVRARAPLRCRLHERRLRLYLMHTTHATRVTPMKVQSDPHLPALFSHGQSLLRAPKLAFFVAPETGSEDVGSLQVLLEVSQLHSAGYADLRPPTPGFDT